jgi:hypothetical protein
MLPAPMIPIVWEARIGGSPAGRGAEALGSIDKRQAYRSHVAMSGNAATSSIAPASTAAFGMP